MTQQIAYLTKGTIQPFSDSPSWLHMDFSVGWKSERDVKQKISEVFELTFHRDECGQEPNFTNPERDALAFLGHCPHHTALLPSRRAWSRLLKSL